MTGPGGTLGGRLRHQRQQRFVGRAAEIELFMDSAVRPHSPRYNLLMFTGVGGIGKSALLAELTGLARLASPNVAFATLETSHSSLELMRAWRGAFNSSAFKKFDKEVRRYTTVASKVHNAAGSVSEGALKALGESGVVGAFVAGAIGEDRLRAFLSKVLSGRETVNYIDGPGRITAAFIEGVNEVAGSGRVFLFLDYYEAVTQELDEWMRHCLESELSTESVLVLAGRESLDRVNREWTAFQPILRSRELRPFVESEAEEYLDRSGIDDPETRQKLKEFTSGLPWALELSVEAIDSAARLGDTPATLHEVRSMVVRRFLGHTESHGRLREFIEAACVLEAFNLEALASLVDQPTTTEVEDLTRYSFITQHPDGRFAVKEVVRESVIEIVRQQSPIRLRGLHERAAQHYHGAVERSVLFSPAWQTDFLEGMRHTAGYDPALAVQQLTELVGKLPAQVWRVPCAGALAVLSADPVAMKDPRLRYLTGEDARASGGLASARDCYRSVADDPAASPTLQLSAVANLIEIHHRIGNTEAALQGAMEGYDRAITAERDDHAAMFAARLAEMYGVLGYGAESDQYYRTAVSRIEPVTDNLVAGQISLVLVYMLAFAGRYAEAQVHLSTAIQRWKRAEYEFGVAQAESSVAWLGWLTGQTAAGLAAGRRAFRYFEQIDDEYNAGMVSMNLGELYRQSARPEEALRWFDEAGRRLEATEGYVYLAITRYRRGRTYLGMGRTTEGLHELEAAVALERERVREPYSLGMALLYLADACQRLGDARAVPVLEEAERVLVSAQNRHGRVLAHLNASVLGVRLGTVPDPLARFTETLAAATASGFADVEAAARLALATHLLGDGGTVEPDADSTVEAGSQLGMALIAAVRFSPYLADEVFTSCNDVLQALSPDTRNGVAVTMTDTFRSHPAAVATDRKRRLEEGEGNLRAPISEQCDALLPHRNQ
ncbi:hypothetical protein [Actinoplanes sp. CA-252034]|uniref:hypothetical protein n=1 Tax=Actinoplanes sp. CA-252034 TaxID=3239906 RepID=UPI003D975C67